MVALASCDKSDNGQADGPHAIRFTADISAQDVTVPQSRAAGTEWKENDAIGVFMVTHAKTDIAQNAENMKFTNTANGMFQSVSGNEIYCPTTGGPVDFIAYYPHQDRIGIDSKIPVITTDQSNQSSFDMMWAKADNKGKGYDKTNSNNIPLTFSHRLAKLTMNCNYDDNTGYSDLNDMTVAIKGMNTEALFTVKDGVVSSAKAPAEFAARKSSAATGYKATHDAILLPASYEKGTVTVTFKTHNESFTWDMDQVEFKAGNEYVYEVILSRTGVAATGTISPWNTQQKDPVYAD